MKIKLITTQTFEVDNDVYKEWMSEGEDNRNWNDLSNEDKLKVITDCESEVGFEIAQADAETTNFKLELV